MGLLDNKYGDRSRDDRPLVLIIEDEPDTIQILSHLLHDAGYRSTWADDARTGLAIAEKYRPDAILLDLTLPDMDGFAVCRELKSRLTTADTPVIFVSGRPRTDDVVAECFDAGGHDFLVKPINHVHLSARLRVALRELSIREAYRRLAILDPMTGLSNRRQFFIHLMETMMIARRDRCECFLIMADIDGLAIVNERYGHEFGDEVILTFARLIKRMLGPQFRAGRIGGEEFAIALINSTRDRARAVAERISNTFAAISFDASSQPKHFYAGFGIAEFSGEPKEFDADQFITQADIGLFVAKEAGHGKVKAFWELDPNSLPHLAPNKRHARSKHRKRTQRSFLLCPIRMARRPRSRLCAICP